MRRARSARIAWTQTPGHKRLHTAATTEANTKATEPCFTEAAEVGVVEPLVPVEDVGDVADDFEEDAVPVAEPLSEVDEDAFSEVKMK